MDDEAGAGPRSVRRSLLRTPPTKSKARETTKKLTTEIEKATKKAI